MRLSRPLLARGRSPTDLLRLYGFNSVLSALQSQSRPAKKLILQVGRDVALSRRGEADRRPLPPQKRSSGRSERTRRRERMLTDLADAAGVRVEFVPRDRLDNLTQRASHQGFALDVRESRRPMVNDVPSPASLSFGSDSQRACVVVLDGVTDPQVTRALARACPASRPPPLPPACAELRQHHPLRLLLRAFLGRPRGPARARLTPRCAGRVRRRERREVEPPAVRVGEQPRQRAGVARSVSPLRALAG